MNTIALAAVLAVATFHGAAATKTPTANSDVGLNTTEMIKNHGYTSENHYITTEDGYILTYQRIPFGKNDEILRKRPAVLLMHGLGSSSSDYISLGPERGLGYILADIGYDVWLGNARGNAWSRNHTTLDPVLDAEKFFNFSWHEIGYYDTPAAVDYILKISGNDGLYYIGHSQGSTSFLVFGSTRPEYNSKIKLASLMGPAAFMDHQNNSILLDLGKNIYETEQTFKDLHIYEFPFPDLVRQYVFAFCTQPENYDGCTETLGIIIGIDRPQLEPTDYALIFSNVPSNAAIKQFIHFGQLFGNGGFAQYDYGAEKNLEVYGSKTPPAYDLSKITAPVAVYYGKNDGLVNYMDAITVVNSVANLANDYLVPHDLFTHWDFFLAKDVFDLLYVNLIKTMQSY